ncbi:MAG: RadC family protein [Bacteroidota bacterium]|jgi:DNA repair protein RadC
MDKVSEITISYRPPRSLSKSPIVRSSRDAYMAMIPHFNSSTIAIQEQFVICYLTRSNQIKGIFPGFVGGISGTVVDIRIILAVALKSGSSAIILAHNHPSGNTSASETDKMLTSKIKAACETMDIQLLDHLIISPLNTYMSFADEGLL